MSLYDQWQELASYAQTSRQQAFWDDYFAEETGAYKKILARPDTVVEGTVKDVAEKLGLEPVVTAGFLDGANTSLKEEIDLSTLEEDTAVKLEFDYEKLFFNMNDAKAKWLYTLPEWDAILPEERRVEITREWRRSRQAVSEKAAGRNDPCPCGSGRKYKKCCMLKETD
jgi:hypothetical protein